MRALILALISALATSLTSCKKKDSSPPATKKSTPLTIVNLSDNEDYKVFSYQMPDTAILKQGESTKTYTITSNNLDETLWIIKQSYADTMSVGFYLAAERDNFLFIKNDGLIFLTYNCKETEGKAYFRFLNLYGNKFLSVLDSSNNIVKEYYQNTTYGYVPSAVNGEGCTSFNGGKYTLQFRNNAITQIPAHIEKDFVVEKNKVYYFYLNSKNEFKWITL